MFSPFCLLISFAYSYHLLTNLLTYLICLLISFAYQFAYLPHLLTHIICLLISFAYSYHLPTHIVCLLICLQLPHLLTHIILCQNMSPNAHIWWYVLHNKSSCFAFASFVGFVVDFNLEVPGSIPRRKATFFGLCSLITLVVDAKFNKNPVNKQMKFHLMLEAFRFQSFSMLFYSKNSMFA